MFFWGGSAWPRPVTDHPSKSSSTCSHSFHWAEKQSWKEKEDRAAARKHFEWKIPQKMLYLIF
jgi:hypothetical protein